MSAFARTDDLVLPFTVEPLDVRGRVVRLGAALDTIITKHGYPPQVCRALGEALALTALLGSALKLEGRFQLQTKTDGVINMIVVDYEAPDRLRAYARFDAAQLAAVGQVSTAALIGQGHLALTIDRGGDMSRYQGVVVLNGEGFEAAAHHYFQQSEQIPTLVRLAVAEHLSAQGRQWRAGGIMAQFLPHSSKRPQTDLHPGDAPAGLAPESAAPQEDDLWVEASALISTVADHELTDPLLPPEHLLYRLFHERGATVFETMPLRQSCRCSRANILTMLGRFSPQDCRDMIDTNGRIGVTCEFCSTHYDIDPKDVTTEPA